MSKSIRLSDEAYERLEAQKGEDETFSVEDAIEERRERRRGQLEAVADRIRET